MSQIQRQTSDLPRTTGPAPARRPAQAQPCQGARVQGEVGRVAAGDVLALQRTVGNRAVQQMVARVPTHLGWQEQSDRAQKGDARVPTSPVAGKQLPLQASNGTTSVKRREYPDSPAPAKIDPGDWTESDRTNWTKRWKDACEHNLLNLRNEEYSRVSERRDFYKWFYEATADRGYHTRWALAAYVVAANMAEVVDVDWSEGVAPVNNEIQGLARIGNQVIFDDVLPKLKRLWEHGPVKGTDALKRDAEILAEEQNLVQSMYNTLSADTMKRFEKLSTGYYTRVAIGKWAPQWRDREAGQLRWGGKVGVGPYHKGGDVPPFTGDITKPEDRWKYGMELVTAFSTLPSPGPAGTMPGVGTPYTSGSEYKRLNVRPNLHRIDAMLNDANVPEQAVVERLEKLTTSEQRELMSNPWRIRRLTNALSYAEMKKGVEAFTALRLIHKFELLERSLTRSWTSVDYWEVQPMILLASTAERKELHTGRWKKVFIDICDDATIVTATRNLGLPPTVAKSWIDEEQSVF